MKQKFSTQNKLKFSTILCTTNWDPLFTINNKMQLFIISLKRLKRIYNKSFPFNNISVNTNVLNNFFTSVFNQAPHFQANQPLTLTTDTFISQIMSLTPVNNNGIII